MRFNFLINKIQSIQQNSNTTLVFCFDDLERWSGELDVCLAYINKLVEQDHVKCILLGNTEAFDEKAIQQLSKAREKSIRFIYKFENTTSSVIDISIGLIDYQSQKSTRFMQSLIKKNRNYLEAFLNNIQGKNIRSLTEALQLYEYIYTHNKQYFEKSDRLSFTYFITLLSTLILLKKHFLHKKERDELLEGNFEDNQGFPLLKKLGYFDKNSPEYINDESKILLDTIFYRLDEIPLKGVFSIIENGFYNANDFENCFVDWHNEQPYEKYLDKFYYYQLEEKDALNLLNSVIALIFDDQSVTNPATLLLLSERILTDIQRDVIDLDLEQTKVRFKQIIQHLYDSEKMDVLDINFLDLREDRYNISSDIFQFTMISNKQYISNFEIKNHKDFWKRLSESPDIMPSLLEEYSHKPIFNSNDCPQNALLHLETLNNSQLYQFAQKLQERKRNLIKGNSSVKEVDESETLAESIFKQYKYEYSIRASNMKEIADILY